MEGTATLLMEVGEDCHGVIEAGQLCFNTLTNQLFIGDGTMALAVEPLHAGGPLMPSLLPIITQAAQEVLLIAIGAWVVVRVVQAIAETVARRQDTCQCEEEEREEL